MSKQKDSGLVGKFLKVFLMSFAMLVIVLGIGTVMYVQSVKGNTYTGEKQDGSSDGAKSIDVNDNQQDKPKKVTTFAVFGVDKDGFRTDVILLVFFNAETKKIDIISVPRDTKVKMPDEIYAEVKTRRSDVEQIVKINEVAAYANAKLRNETSVAVIEESFGIDVDYYVNMNLNGFRSIVDIVGPITVEIPFDMKYEDPFQDLYINLDKGTQSINGAQAESLIRYRSGYSSGDLGRIEMQKEFMIAFMEELLKLENKINIVNIAAATMVYVETDFNNSVDYLQFIDDISVENVSFETLPGEAVYAKRSYFIYDYELTKEMLNNIMNGTEDEATIVGDLEDTIEPVVIIDVKSLTISVQNGTNKSGLAGSTKKMLIEEGYNAIEAIDYSGDDIITKTKLIVPTKQVADELGALLDDPTIEIDSQLMDKEIQVIIILGPS